MTSTTNVVSITQHLPEPVLGRVRVGFSINLGDAGFRRFLNNLPEGQAAHYEHRAEVLKQPVVEVTLPDGFQDTFDLNDPVNAISEMQAMARHHKINTAAFVLDRMAMAVESLEEAS